MVGAATDAHLAHAVGKVVLPVPGPVRLDECPIELCVGQSGGLSPVEAGSRFVVVGMEVDLEHEGCRRVVVGPHPIDEQAYGYWTGVGE